MKRMKSFAVLASLALVVMMSSAVWAGHGAGRGAGFQPPQLTAEQQAALATDRAAFLTETEGLRKEIATKGIELRTLQAQANPDQAKVRALSDELVDLGAQLAKKRNAVAAKYPAGAFGPGAGCGMGMGGGRGMGGGMGGGMGMGFGPCAR